MAPCIKHTILLTIHVCFPFPPHIADHRDVPFVSEALLLLYTLEMTREI